MNRRGFFGLLAAAVAASRALLAAPKEKAEPAKDLARWKEEHSILKDLRRVHDRIEWDPPPPLAV